MQQKLTIFFPFGVAGVDEAEHGPDPLSDGADGHHKSRQQDPGGPRRPHRLAGELRRLRESLLSKLNPMIHFCTSVSMHPHLDMLSGLDGA